MAQPGADASRDWAAEMVWRANRMRTVLGILLFALFTALLVLTYPLVFNRDTNDLDDDDL